MNQLDRIRGVIERLQNHFRKVTVNAAAPTDSIARVSESFSQSPNELLRFFEICDGISVSVENDVRGILFSISESLDRLAQKRLNDQSEVVEPMVLQRLKYPIQNTVFCPAIGAHINTVPTAEPLRQTAPLAAVFGNVQDGV